MSPIHLLLKRTVRYIKSGIVGTYMLSFGETNGNEDKIRMNFGDHG